MRDIGGYSTEYEIQVWEGHENSLDPSLVKLDPINVARRADMEKLRKAAERMRLPFSIRALKICSDLSVFLSLVKQPMIKPWEKPVSAKKWDEHVKALALYGVVEEIEFPQLKNGARYFGVMKGTDAARSIWNGRRTSSLLEPPPSVNLPYLPRVLKMIDDLVKEHGPVTIIEGDIRHFFHQLSVCEEIGRYLGLRITIDDKLRSFAWRCVPMGLSWSPFIAQSIAWLCVLCREDDEEDLFDIPVALKELPEFVPLRSGGFITIYYDNILAVGVDAASVQKLFDRIIRNMSPEHGFNLQMKRFDIYSPKQVMLNPVNFLGANLSLVRLNRRYHLRWCQATPPTIDTEKLMSYLKGIVSPRAVARYIGKLIWVHSLTLNPIGDISGLLRTLSRVSKERIRRKKDWSDMFIVLTEEERECIRSLWRLARKNPADPTKWTM